MLLSTKSIICRGGGEAKLHHTRLSYWFAPTTRPLVLDLPLESLLFLKFFLFSFAFLVLIVLMESSFQVKDHGFSGFDDHGFSVFDSFIPGNIGVCRNPQGGVGESLVLDGEKGELVKAPMILGKKQSLETRNVAALKSHSEAERRRRERINSHLATLRNFVPCTDKMDKATLLAEVISQVKVLKKQATDATNGLLIPTDADELTVMPYNDYEGHGGVFAFRASICCEHNPELIPDMRRAIDGLKLTIAKAEISTLGSRVKSVFIITSSKEEINCNHKRERLSTSIHQALRYVLDKVSASEEYSPRTTFPNKRQSLLL